MKRNAVIGSVSRFGNFPQLDEILIGAADITGEERRLNKDLEILRGHSGTPSSTPPSRTINILTPTPPTNSVTGAP